MDIDLLHAAWLVASRHFFNHTSESEGEGNSAMQEDVFEAYCPVTQLPGNTDV